RPVGVIRIPPAVTAVAERSVEAGIITRIESRTMRVPSAHRDAAEVDMRFTAGALGFVLAIGGALRLRGIRKRGGGGNGEDQIPHRGAFRTRFLPQSYLS